MFPIKQIIISILFVAFYSCLFSQTEGAELKGRIFDENNSPYVDAYIVLFKADTSEIVKYSLTDEQGFWQMDGVGKGKYILAYNIFSYKSHFENLTVSKDSTFEFTHILVPLNYDLPESTVMGERIGLRSSGDTIFYDIAAYTNGKEEKLGDILKKLPGVSVDEEGNIFYNGKKVSQLFLHGKDALGNMHKMASEGIKAGDIKDVKIIEHYQTDAQRMFGEHSDKIALDVGLKDESLNKWSGELLGGLGYQERYEATVALYKVNEKLGLTFFTKSNNTDLATLSMSDYFGLTNDLADLVNDAASEGGGANLEDIVPKRFGSHSNTTNGYDASGVMNMDYKPNPKSQLKSSILLSYLNTETYSDINRIYNSSIDTFNGNSLEKLNAPLLLGNVYYKYKYGKNILEADLSLDYSHEQDKRSLDGNIGNRDFNSKDFSDFQQRKIKIKIKYGKKIANDYGFRYVFRYGNEYKNGALSLEDESAIYGEENTASSFMGYSFLQKRNTRQDGFSNTISLNKKKKDILYKFNVLHHYEKINNSFDASPELSSFSGTTSLNRNLWGTSIGIYKKKTRFNWNNNFLISYHDRSHSVKQESLLSYKLSSAYKYKIDKVSFLLFNIAHSKNPPQIKYYNYLSTAQNINQITRGTNEILANTYSFNLNLTMFKIWIEKQSTLFISTGYGYSVNPVNIDNELSNNIMESFPSSLGFSNDYHAKINYKNTIFRKKINQKISYSYHRNHQQKINRNYNQTSRHSFDLAYSSRFKKNFEGGMNLGLKRNSFNSKSIILAIKQHSTNLLLGLNINYNKKIKKENIKLKASIVFNQQIYSVYMNNNYLVSSTIEWHRYKNWTLFLKAQNIFNFNPNEILISEYHPDFIENRKYLNQKGFLLIGYRHTI